MHVGTRCPSRSDHTSGVVVMAPGNLELTRQFWQILREGGDLGVIVQKLTASFASDLASLPEFVAIVASGSDLHVAIRGNYELVVHGPQGSQSVTSGSVIMWSEFRFVDVQSVAYPAQLPLREGLKHSLNDGVQ